MQLSILILSYNTKQLTITCLESVIAELRRAKLLETAEIIVTDNASTDGSPTAIGHYLRLQSVKHQVIANTKNLGFPKGNNQAIAAAQGDFLLLLNSDTVVQAGSLSQLVDAMIAHPPQLQSATLRDKQPLDRLGILAASLTNPDGSYQPQGGDLPNMFNLVAQWSGLDDMPVIGKWLHSPQHTGKSGKAHSVVPGTQIQEKGWVGATAMLIRREVLDEIGLLDERIFMYGEDVEFCLRAHNHHWDIGMLTTAQVTHLGSASSSSENAIIGEILGLQYIWSKHKPSWQLPLVKMLLKIGVIIRIILFGIILPDSARARAYKKALAQI